MWRLIFLAATSSSAPTQFNNPWDKSPNDGQANRGQDANSSGNNKSNNDGDKHAITLVVFFAGRVGRGHSSTVNGLQCTTLIMLLVLFFTLNANDRLWFQVSSSQNQNEKRWRIFPGLGLHLSACSLCVFGFYCQHDRSFFVWWSPGGWDQNTFRSMWILLDRELSSCSPVFSSALMAN